MKATLEQALSRAKEKEWTTQRIICKLDALGLLDRGFIEHCKSMRAELVPSLLGAMHESRGTARLNASLLLLHLGECRGTKGIVECLRSNDEELQKETLLRLTFLPLEPVNEKSQLLREAPVPLDAPLVFVELKRFLTQPDTRVGSLALQTAMKLDLPEAETCIKPLLRHPSRKVRTDVLNRWFARRCIDQGALQAAQELLFDNSISPDENYRVVAALEAYCKCDRRELAMAAAELLARFMRANVDYPGNSMANLIARALKSIQVAGHHDEYAVVETVFDSAVKDWRRGVALRRLAELDGMARADQLVDALFDRTLRQFAAESLAGIAAASNNHKIIEALLNSLQEEDRDSVSHKLVDALLAIGGKDITLALEQVSGQLAPHDAMRVFWLANDISPEQAIERLATAGAIPASTQLLDEEIAEQWCQDRRPMSLIYTLLLGANRLAWFDCETSMVPPDYVKLIEYLAGISRGIFDVESISQEVNPDTGESEIMFVRGNEAYCFCARDFGDYYDVESVMEGLNAALADLGYRERFIMLHTGDQTGIITFASEVGFRRVARELRLPLEDDYQAAMKAGVAFERYVREKHGKGVQRDEHDSDVSRGVAG